MSNAKTTVLDIINGAAVWMKQKELIDASGMTTGTVSPALKELLGENAIQRIKPPAGWAKGVQWIYGMNGLQKPEPPPDADKPERPKKRKAKPKAGRKTKPASRRGKHHKGKRDKAKPRAAAKADQRAPASPDQRIALTPAGERMIAPRVALTNGGTFLLLDTGVELNRAHTRALIDFVRKLDRGEA